MSFFANAECCMELRATELKTNLEEVAAFLQSLMKYRIPFEKHKKASLLRERRWVRILYGPDVAEGWEDWLLEIRYTAGPQEVCDGQAEYVGEETFMTQFPIMYCPYCGHFLTQPGPVR